MSRIGTRENKRSTVTTVAADGWLRRLFVEHWSLKLLALAITLVLWFLVSGHRLQREVLVEPRIEGKPAPAFEVREVLVTPSRIKVQGPANQINGIEKLTLPISVEGRSESFDAPGLTLPVSDPNVEALGTVSVHVTIVATGNSTGKSPKTN